LIVPLMEAAASTPGLACHATSVLEPTAAASAVRTPARASRLHVMEIS
jgi:hypothetical protein